MDARRRRLDGAGQSDPLARVAALLVAISRNNSYEGRDPHIVPDTLSSGFVADLLGLDIGVLAAYLVELRKLGLLEQEAATGLRIKNLEALELLADVS